MLTSRGYVLPWTTLTNVLATHGLYVDNYPHRVSPPGTMKSIGDLSSNERLAILKALTTEDCHPMTFLPVGNVPGMLLHC